MQRINSTNVAENLHGIGKDGFKGGNPQTGEKSTYLTPEWCNGLQEEVVRVIESAGITPSDENYEQLLAAIKYFAWGVGQTGAPWLRRYPSGTTVPTTYAGDIIYIGTDKYEWVDGTYVHIKSIATSANTFGSNNTTSCSVVVSVPKAGLLYITGSRVVSNIETSGEHFSRISLDGTQLSSDTTRTTITHSVTAEVTKGTHTVMLEGQYFLDFRLWLSVLYVPN